MNTIIIAIIIIIILLWFYNKDKFKASESMVNLVYKRVPLKQIATKDAIKIDAIPLSQSKEQYFAEDAPVKPVYSDEKPHISLTFDASVAHNALMRSRDKAMFDAIANRNANYWRPIFEEEMQQCENRNWWDDVEYPMNDSGESTIIPQEELPTYPYVKSM